tara:strand:- start:585 stop:1094 length:510 start_codon:yes stop_codon:yes gene_type:complete
MTQTQNFKALCSLATELLELPKGSLAYKSRKQTYQVARSAVSCIARMTDNIHQSIIAKELNRDRSLIYHYDKMHIGNYRSWELYRNTFNTVYNAYTKLKNSRKAFVDKFHMQKYLKANGVKSSLINNQSIIIKCNNLKITVILSYEDFSDQLKIINLALKEYNYSLEIL